MNLYWIVGLIIFVAIEKLQKKANIWKDFRRPYCQDCVFDKLRF